MTSKVLRSLVVCGALLGAAGCRPGESLVAPVDVAAPPTEFTATPVSVRGIRLAWQALPGSTVIGYRVERRVNLSGDFGVLQSLVPQAPGQAMAYFDSELEPETFYGYRLIAIDRLGNESPPSSVAGAKTPSVPGIEVRTVVRTDPAFDDPNGYSISIVGPETIRSAVGSRGTRQFKPLAPGTYEVTFGDLAARCSPLSEPSRQVIVTDQGVTTIAPVEFEVLCRDPQRGRIFAGLGISGEIPPGGEFVVDVTGIASDASLPASDRAYAQTLRFASPTIRELQNLRPGAYQVDLTSIPTDCLREGSQRREVNVGPLSVDSVQFEVRCGSAANEPPVAQANGPYTGVIGVPIAMTGAGSADPDGSIASYAWDFGDGTTGTGPAPSKTYITVGTYTVTLTVTDNRGASATSQAQVTVTSGATGPAPTWRAEFGPMDQATRRVTLRITVDLSADLSATPGPEALATWAIESLRWNPAVLQYFSFNFGSGATGSVNPTNQASGELKVTGTQPGSGSTGLVTIARVQFTVLGAAGATTSTTTTLGPILGTPSTGGFNYRSFLDVVEGQFTVPGGTGGGTGTVAGTVRRSTGEPIAGATVAVNPGGTATTNATGQYSVANVAVGSGTVVVSGLPSGCTAPAAQNYAIPVAGQTATVDLSVSCGGGGGGTGTVAGTVRRSTGEAIVGATVTVAPGGTATTNATGQFSVANVPVGSGTVTVGALPAGCTVPASRPYTIAAAGQTTTVDIAVTCGGGGGGTGTVAGTVRRSTGEAIAGATATVAPGGTATTGAGGQYSVANVPAGTGTVTLSSLPSGCQVPAAKNYTVASGQTATVDFSVTCAAAGNAVTGSWTVTGTTATLELRANVVTANLGTAEFKVNINSSRLEYVRVEAAATPNLPNVFGESPPRTVVGVGAFTTQPGGATGDVGIIRLIFTIKTGAATTVASTLTGPVLLDSNFNDVAASFAGRITVQPLTLP